MFRSRVFIALLLSIILITPMHTIKAAEHNNERTRLGYATWLWHTEQIIHNTDQIINFLLKNNVKYLYLQVDYALDLDVYKAFIKKASANGIDVHALEGAPDWVSDRGGDKQQMFFDWLTEYQETALEEEKFTGIHLDVEPYLQEQYHINRNAVLENYQDFLMHALGQSEGLALPLAIDIPFWFDEVSYDTKYGSGILAQWIISRVKNITIMAYRDSALDNNGIIQLVSTEIELANKYDAVIIIAVETQRSDEGNTISFYEEGQQYMNNELNKVYNTYQASLSFGGFAIHHVMSWMKLKTA